MARFRKKPVVIEAEQYPGHSIDGVDKMLAFEEWLKPLAVHAGCWPLIYRGQWLIVPTLEGEYWATPGDWIIQGIKGELYPCKPDIFAETYEAT